MNSKNYAQEYSNYIIDKMMKYENKYWKDDSIKYLDNNLLEKLETEITIMNKSISFETWHTTPSPLFHKYLVNKNMSLIDAIAVGCEAELNDCLKNIEGWDNVNNCLKEIINHFN